MATLTDRDVADIATIAAAAIRVLTPGLCASLVLFPCGENGECAEGCEIVAHPARTAPGGELLRIDDHLFHRDASSPGIRRCAQSSASSHCSKASGIESSAMRRLTAS